MEAATLMNGYTPKNLPQSCFRRSSHGVKATIIIVVLSCILFQFAASGPCILGETKEKNNACQSLVDDNFISDSVQENSKNHKSSDKLLFPSKLHGFPPKSHHSDAELGNSSWWSSDSGISKLLSNGKTLSCSWSAVRRNQKDDRSSFRKVPLYSIQRGVINLQNSASFEGSYVEIELPMLDWGEKNHLYSPAFAFLTMSNNCNGSIFIDHQPFSMDSQFYTCNFTKALPGLGESNSICFVFLLKQTGLPSSHLILQTNSGGFLVQAKGSQFPSIIKDWLLVTSHVSSLLAMQPHENWEIRPKRTETIMEIDFSFGSVGKIFGAFCMKLMKHHQDSSNVLRNPHQYGNKRTELFDPGLTSVLYGKELESATLEQVASQNWKSQGTNSDGISILKHNEVIFPILLVGNHFSKWIMLRNPTPNPVVMQLILNSEEIIYGCNAATLVHREAAMTSKYRFSLSVNARTEAFVHPNGTAYLGPIVFHPSNRCQWRSSGLVRSNLSGVEWSSLQGRGGSYALEILLEKTEPVENLEFRFEVPDSLNSSTPGGGNVNRACSVPLKKELYMKNTGDLPLEVKKIKVSGTDCGLDGFAVHNCSQFTLNPGDSAVLHVTYKSNFLSSIVHGDLELALATGIIVVPMKAVASLYMLELCKKSSVSVRAKKMSGAFILIGSLICFVIFFLHQGNKNDSVSVTLFKQGSKNDDSGSATPIPKVAPFQQSGSKDKILRLESAREVDRQSGSGEWKGLVGKKQDAEDSRNRTCPVDEDSRNRKCSGDDNQEKVNLTVETGKEKSRRRRKRRGRTTAAVLEVSSSQSGNSTPSSPLSPASASSATPTRSLFPLSPDGVEFRVLKNSSVPPFLNPNKPQLLPSATFPCSGRDRRRGGLGLCLASTATIPPHARAPGSELFNEKVENLEKKKKHEFTYDIWGDHLSVLDLMRRSSAMNSQSESFFVRGPQTLMTKFQYESSVSSTQAG